MQVFDIEDIVGVPTAVVARPRDCTMCRECIRTDNWSERVQLRRKADHFLFSVESVGSLAPEVIVREVSEYIFVFRLFDFIVIFVVVYKAVSILKEKAVKFHDLVEQYETSL
jgi:hypothetical protein